MNIKKEIIKKQDKIIRILGFILLMFVIVLIGGIMNFIVIIDNGSKMPVLYSFDYSNKEYFSYQDSSEVNYPSLTDKYKIGDTRWSLGDILLTIGFYGFFILAFILCINLFQLYKLQKSVNYKVIKTQWKGL